MADPSTPYKPLDPGRIDALNQSELQYWSKELHCTEPDLAQAVRQVGDHVAKVREYLEGQGSVRRRT